MGFEVHLVVEDVVKLLEGGVRARGLRCRFVIAPEVPQVVQGDPTPMRQLLTDLLSLALECTRQGEVMVRVSVLHSTKTRLLLLFEVAETGNGMKLKAQRQLPGKSKQVGNTLTLGGEGRSLDLGLARSLATEMGGHVGVVGEPGQGFSFWFTAWFAASTGTSAVSP